MNERTVDKFRRLITESGQRISEISRDSGIDESWLRRAYNGTVTTVDATRCDIVIAYLERRKKCLESFKQELEGNA